MTRPISQLALARALAFGLAFASVGTTLGATAVSAKTQEEMPTVTNDMPKPVAEKRPHTYTVHGITVEDPYDWLYDKSYPVVDDADVLQYLNTENAYFEYKMAAQAPLTDALFKEMRARIKEDDSTVPQKDGDYLYWSEFEEGAQYRKHYRKPVAGGEAELLIDENALAEGQE